jgi:hypothetical protein
MSDYKVSRISFEVNDMLFDYPNESYQFINGNYESIMNGCG